MALLPIYEPATCKAINRFVDVAFKSHDSLFTPGVQIWSSSIRDDLYGRFVLHPDETKGVEFLTKFEKQLKDAPPEIVQLAAEILYVQLLTPTLQSIGLARKISLVETVLSWLKGPAVALPDDLKAGLKGGLSKDQSFQQQRPYQLMFLLETFRAWDGLDHNRRDTLLSDPWEFKAFLQGIPVKAAQSMREILCFFVHPQHFEAITSGSMKAKIVNALRDPLTPSTGDVDKDLLAIRTSLSKEYGEQFNFFQPDVKSRWIGDKEGGNGDRRRRRPRKRGHG